MTGRADAEDALRTRSAASHDDGALPSGAPVVVVGAGVTGLSAAWWLARAGVKAVVIDKGLVGWEASGRNGGGASHWHSPLFHEEQRLWPQMDDLLGYQTEYRSERIIVAMSETQLVEYEIMATRFEARGVAVSRLDPIQARAAAPLVSPANLGAIHVHGGGHANPQRTVQAYAWALEDLGGRIVQNTPVTGFRQSGGRVSAVRTARGEIACDALVVAAGPQSGLLLEGLGVALPLTAARAEMIVTEPAPLMPIGGVDGNGLYGRQTLRGNLAYGGGPHEWIETEPDGPRARPSSPLSRHLARRVLDLFPSVAALRVIRSWAGIVETTPDGRPVLDRLATPENVVVATMSGVGFGLSPASGRAICDLVLDGRCSFADIAKLGIGRFATLPADWRDRRGWVPPPSAPG
jgi:sarcosine oxidase subunit beta